MTVTATATLPQVPAPTQRSPYAREGSLSPLRATTSASNSRGRRFSHSKSRPAVDPSSSGAYYGGKNESLSQDRGSSLSDSGSRAPLWRLRDRSRLGGRSQSRGASENKAEELEDNATESTLADKTTSPRVPRTMASKLPPLLGHFFGHRPPKPLGYVFLTPLAFLPKTVEPVVLGWIGGFVSILLACGVSVLFSYKWYNELPLAIGSLGATAVLLYSVPEGPLSQPRQLVGGHFLSALTGAIIGELFSLSPRWNYQETATQDEYSGLVPVALALAVGTAISVMQVTKTIHPPGGATALIAVTQRDRWAYVLLITVTVSFMGIWAMIINNLGRGRRYPTHWWTPVTAVVDKASTTKPSPEKDPGNSQGKDGRLSIDEEDARVLGAVGEELEGDDDGLEMRGRPLVVRR